MNKFLKVLGIIFLVVVVLFVAEVINLVIGNRRVAQETKPFVDTAIVAITTDWDMSQLTTRATPRMVGDMNSTEGKRLFAAFSTLGKLTKFNGSTYQGYTTFSSIGKPNRTTAWYISGEEFAHGAAKITVNIEKDNGQWKIYGFHVDSDALLAQPPSPKI